MTEQHLYTFQPYALSSDPNFPQTGEDFYEAWRTGSPQITLDGTPMNCVRWCVTGNPGMISLWLKQNEQFVIDEATGRVKHELRRGCVEVVLLDNPNKAPA